MKLFIEKSINTGKVEVFACVDEADRVTYFSQENGDLVAKSIAKNDYSAQGVSPLIVLPHSLFEDFKRAMLEYLSNQGISTENENLLKGKLAATESHLADMQKAFNKLLEKA